MPLEQEFAMSLPHTASICSLTWIKAHFWGQLEISRCGGMFCVCWLD